MTALDLSEHSLNLYTSKKRIIKRVIFQGRQSGGEPPTFSIAAAEVPTPSSPSSLVSTLGATSTGAIANSAGLGFQPSSPTDGTFAANSSTSQTMSTPTQRATVTVTLSISPTITTTAFLHTAKRPKSTLTGVPNNNGDVQSAQVPEQNQKIFPMGTIGAIIMAVLFAVMMGFVLFVARKRFGFPRSSPMNKLRKEAMAARMTNAILQVEPKSYGGREHRRNRSLLSLVTLSSFRRGRSRPGSQRSSLPPFSPASFMAESRPPQSPSAPIASSSRRTLSNEFEPAVDAPSSLHAFLAASGSNPSNAKSESSRPPQLPMNSYAEGPDDLDTPVFLTASPKSTAFERPRK